MAKLISCKMCNEQISPYAKACPKCGDDLEGHKKNNLQNKKLIAMVIAVVGLFILIKTGLFQDLVNHFISPLKQSFNGK